LVERLGVVLAMRVLYGLTLVSLVVITVMNWKYLEETLPKPHASRSDLPKSSVELTRSFGRQ
jgi:hypothetical protein